MVTQGYDTFAFRKCHQGPVACRAARISQVRWHEPTYGLTPWPTPTTARSNRCTPVWLSSPPTTPSMDGVPGARLAEPAAGVADQRAGEQRRTGSARTHAAEV